MGRRTVTAAGREYQIADDDAPRREHLWWAVLRTRVVDEITSRPPRGTVHVTTTTLGCVPCVGPDGVVGLAVRPRDVSAALVSPGALAAQVSVPGYLPRSLDSAIDGWQRRLPGGAPAGTTTLDVLPLDSPREQFLPGRGVVLQRSVSTDPEQFTSVANPTSAPAANQVPLVDAVAPARLGGATVAGIPLVLPDQPLHMASVATLHGHATRPGGLNSALATIGIDGLWWTQPEIAAHANPPHPAHLVSFSAALAFEHRQGGAISRCTLTPADALTRRVSANAAPGERELRIHPWNALNPSGGDVLEIELGNSQERELVITDGFTLPTHPSIPAVVPLRTPLAFPHAAATPVFNRSVASTASGVIDREAQQGDRVLFMAVALAADGAIRLEAGTSRDELRFVRRLPTFATGVAVGADGTFEFPPLARVAQVRIRARYDTDPEIPFIDLALDYRGDNRVRIQFP